MLPTARQFVRLASKTARSDKITVQLLQDYPPLGVRGELVRVKPAFMRNFLHVDNKACYTVDGPRIPVVTRTKTVEVPKPKVVEKVVKERAATPALSLDELSSMFLLMRKNNASKSGAFETAAAQGTYVAELEESLPLTYTLQNASFPVSRDVLAQTVFSVTGVEVPAKDIQVRDAAGKSVEAIGAAGSYTWHFADGTASLKRKLQVQ